MENSDLDVIKKIHKIFKEKKIKLSIAESCTSGYISHLITYLPGASDFFDSSIVCYSVDSKIKLLGIKKTLIEKYGVISKETAEAMADSVRRTTKTDCGLAITGNLGPAVLEGKEAGLVYISVSFEKRTESKCVMFNGSRNEIKHFSSISALEFLREAVSLWT
ncbi:MAG: CinA family protein [Nitrospiraceae bacterium]|nr:CinA family protein [Nitrospiraceae bacterium]